MLVTEAAAAAEDKFHKVISEKGTDFGFSLPQAMLVGVTVTGDGRVILTPEVASRGDIYQLIDSDEAREAVSRFDFVGIATCGWAAPIASGADESDGVPSQHPERRRVRLFVCATRGSTASVLRFQDEPDAPILDGGEAHGPLADAVQSMFA